MCKQRVGRKTRPKFKDRGLGELKTLRKKLQVWLTNRKNQEGVTLIELLAVVVIMSIIAAVAVPVVIGQINNSKIKSDVSDESIIIDAIQRAEFDYESSNTGGYLSLSLPDLASSSPSVTSASYDYTSGTLTDTGTGSPILTANGSNKIFASNGSDQTLYAVLTTGLDSTSGGTGPYLDSIPTPQTSSSGWTILDLSDSEDISTTSPASIDLATFEGSLPSGVTSNEVTSFTLPNSTGSNDTYVIYPTPNS